MTDLELVKYLHALKAQGPSALPELRHTLKIEGGWSRFISLIPVPKKKKPPSTTPRTFLPDDFPDRNAKANAVSYWTEKSRADLAARIDEIVREFRDYHSIPDTPTKSKSWPRSWQTWYRIAVDRVRPPRGAGPTVVALFKDTDIDGWVKRLEIQAGLDSDTPTDWATIWGPEYPSPNHRVPAEAIRIFLTRHPEMRQRG